MTRVSRKSLNQDLQKELESQLSLIVSSLTDKAEIEVFLTEFLTPEEKIMLGKRLVLYMMLFRGASSKDIHNSLSLSYETVRIYKQLYDTKELVFQQTIEKLIINENTKEIWNKIEQLLAPVGLFMQAKNNMKARAKFSSGDWSSE